MRRLWDLSVNPEPVRSDLVDFADTTGDRAVEVAEMLVCMAMHYRITGQPDSTQIVDLLEFLVSKGVTGTTFALSPCEGLRWPRPLALNYSWPVAAYEFTEYFEKKELGKRPYLTKELCIRVVEAPVRIEPQEANRFRFWRTMPELEGKFLRVITLEDKLTIHNAFLDRRFKP